MSTATESEGGDPLHETHIGRRRYLQLVGAAAATAAVGAGISMDRASAGVWDDVSEVAEVTAGGLYLMTGMGVADFLNDDYGVFQDNYEVAESQMDAAIYTSHTMRDGDDRTLSMAWNNLENARDVAWIEAQAAAVKKMQEGASESEVMSAAKDGAEQYLSGTVESNVLNHWNAQCTKIADIIARMKEHADIDALPGSADYNHSNESAWALHLHNNTSENFFTYFPFEVVEVEHTLLNGETKTVKKISGTGTGSTFSVQPLSPLSGDDGQPVDGSDTSPNDRAWIMLANTTTGATSIWGEVDPQRPMTWSEQTSPDNGWAWSDHPTMNKWKIVMDRVQMIYDDVVANVEAWASEAYSALQAGEVDMTDVVSPTVMASEMNTRYDETGHLAYAAAGLAALNLAVDYENMMTIQLSDGSTFQGTLFVDSSFEWSVGETIKPSDVDGAIYAAVDSSTYSRTLTSGDHYRTEIDGGVVRLFLEPIDQAIYTVETNNDETVEIAGSNWTQTNPDAKPEINQGETDWEADVSADLEEPIAEVSSMTVSFTEDVESDTIAINEPFQITEAYDVESGETVETVSGDGGVENYNTVDASKLEQALKQHFEMLKDSGAFESDDALGGGGGGGINVDLGGGGVGDWLGGSTLGVPNWLILATGGSALVLAALR